MWAMQSYQNLLFVVALGVVMDLVMGLRNGHVDM